MVASLRFLATLMAVAVTKASLEDLASCDPLRKGTFCPPDPALAGNISIDFSKSGWDGGLEDFWSVDEASLHDKKRLDFDTDGNDGVAMTISKEGGAPTLTSKKYLLFGRVSVTLKAAKGRGLVTTLVLKSDSGDEIDWELLGAFDNQAATNYYYDGKARYNVYNTTYALSSSSFDAFHTYSVEWTESILEFSIDGHVRQTWRFGDIAPGAWPQTPMRIKLGLWAVGAGPDRSGPTDPTVDRGEVAWAGGEPDWGRDAGLHPFRAYFRALEIEDYVGHCDDIDDASSSDEVEYQYDEKTWGWQNVRIRGCRSRRSAPLVPPLPVAEQEPSATGHGPSPSPSEESDEDDESRAAVLGFASSPPLAALVCLGWLFAW
ncbi:cell wall glucanosyltransferase Mwg1 [Drechmeria coniospora]|uniref:Cell wall glucanosyltransferase Mwg1 n=1 Tax=Drechmeria coniospora TaxID=98403 RepID=A0A151GCJ9_DRECN|nr:cell wall glucanosyltransferase Mwg1 [Drechmeria coniospora]KYK54818.1 cell wall glucanosyltransferase Mwg1 [Drechmeria coniospora]ODA75954.1 hypothetical protein RJ55_08595 [Drechmeria coniospora]